nr:MAG TPA: RloB-like protein [Caudoviricetes sp.]
MSRRKTKFCQNLSTSVKIMVLTEGQTEKNYLKELKNKLLDSSFKLEIENICNGNYASFLDKIAEYRGMETPILIVVDLDRASNDGAELKHLKELIDKLVKINKQNNIFLTYPNFETFLSAHFDLFCNNLKDRLGFRNSDEIKSRPDILNKIEQHGGDFENTKKHFNNNNLFYYKKDFSPALINKNNIRTKQSSLINFIDYCNKIKQSR